MTLIKSLLLGSAAGIVAVASAQAADLPTKKGAPAAQYVKICTITANGTPITGFVLPGSDTCLKISGYLTAQIEGGNLKDGFSMNYAAPVSTGGAVTTRSGQQTNTGTLNRPDFGWTTRFNFTVDAVSNTAYGPLLAHVEVQAENGNGFDTDGEGLYLNRAYLNWAGITAGKANSFFSFTGGGPGWANFFSPDQQGYNQPDLLAYTAAFGGGFSATIAIQSPQTNCFSATGGANIACSGGGALTNDLGADFTYNGVRAPDIVGNLKVTQGWGSAQIAGVAHQVTVSAGPGSSLGSLTQNTWGWAFDGGVSFNLPSFGPGDDFLVTGAYSRNAIWYSGIPDAMWGENGAVNGNGQQLALADTYYNFTTGNWSTPEAWSISAQFDHHFSPLFSLSPEGGYGEIHWSNSGPGQTVSDGTTWIVGGVAHYDPVVNLDFELELLYQNTHNDQPAGYSPGFNGPNGTSIWHANADGFAARFEITRNF